MIRGLHASWLGAIAWNVILCLAFAAIATGQEPAKDKPRSSEAAASEDADEASSDETDSDEADSDEEAADTSDKSSTPDANAAEDSKGDETDPQSAEEPEQKPSGEPGGADAAQPTDSSQAYQQAFELSKSAKGLEDYAKVIEFCRAGLAAGGSEKKAAYGRKLLAWALNRHGEIVAQSGTEDAALADFEEAVQLDPTNWRPVHNRGISFAQQGKLKEAGQDFDTALELKKDNPDLWFNRAELKAQLGDLAGAILDYNQAVKLRPKDPGFLISRGHAYYQQRNYRAALADYSQALKLDKKNAMARTYRADLYVELVRFDEAAVDYQAAIDADAEYGRAYLGASWLMATCPNQAFRDSDRALRAAQKAIELDGDQNYHYLETLAAAQANASKFDDAVATQTKVIELAPKEPAKQVEERASRLALYKQKKPYRFAIKK